MSTAGRDKVWKMDREAEAVFGEFLQAENDSADGRARKDLRQCAVEGVGVPQPTLSLWLKSAGRISVVSDDEKPKLKVIRPGRLNAQK